MLRKSATDARSDISALVDTVHFTKERAIIQKRGKDVVAIVPMEDLRALERLETLIDIRDAEAALKKGGGRPFLEVLEEMGRDED